MNNSLLNYEIIRNSRNLDLLRCQKGSNIVFYFHWCVSVLTGNYCDSGGIYNAMFYFSFSVIKALDAGSLQ